MANIYLRSPKYIAATAPTNAVKVQLELVVDSSSIYTLEKTTSAGSSVLFEVSELLRDYLDLSVDTDSTHSTPYSYVLTFFNSSSGFISISSDTGFMNDGYTYFEEPDGVLNGRSYLQSNNIIYRLEDSDVRIPIDRNETSRVTYLKSGEIVSSENITTSVANNIYYIGKNQDSFKDRVESDGGIFEGNKCIQRFDDDIDLNSVDTIIIEGTNSIDKINVKTISECRYTPAKVRFVNRFGAIQDLWFFKKSIESLSTKTEKYKSNFITSVGTYNRLSHQYKTFDVQGNKKITLNTGYVDESYNEVMQELLLSEQVWMEMDDVTTPMNVDTKSLTFKTSVNDKLVDYKLELSFAYDTINNIR